MGRVGTGLGRIFCCTGFATVLIEDIVVDLPCDDR